MVTTLLKADGTGGRDIISGTLSQIEHLVTGQQQDACEVAGSAFTGVHDMQVPRQRRYENKIMIGLCPVLSTLELCPISGQPRLIFGDLPKSPATALLLGS
ncbi:MAG: hypothetical protein QNI90_13565 [Dinoroseobacter sp.]|nr:hypothetical protein [Dinoroseobacter sp.]